MNIKTYFVEVTVNLMTYLPCNAAGTQCNRPRELSLFSKRSVKVFSPRRRKTTMPRCLGAGISKRASAKTRASNFCASLTPYEYKFRTYIALLIYVANKGSANRECKIVPFLNIFYQI